MTRAILSLDRRSFAVALLAAGVTPAARANEPVRIAAASDLQIVLPELVALFQRTSGVGARVTYGSTGNLARQIRQGAPFDVFLAADERFVLDLVKDGSLPTAGPIYARGRLAVVAGRNQAFHAAVLSADPLAEITAILKAGAGFRVAIANPEHAPYGQRALEVLRARDLLDLFRPRLVFGENVAQATQYVATGAAAIGFVSHSMAGAPPMVEKLVSAAIPASLHSPLDQRLGVSAKASPSAVAFASFIMSAPAQALFSANGFDPLPKG